VERKARFIGQIKTGDLDARTAEDLGSDELGNSAAATKAVGTGDPRYLAQVQLDDDVKRLDALKRAHGTRRDVTPPSGARVRGRSPRPPNNWAASMRRCRGSRRARTHRSP